jgi:CubicO group peptidase (beta-lactamase class C family)
MAAAETGRLGEPQDLKDGWTVTGPNKAGLNEQALDGLDPAIERGDFPKTNAVLAVRRGALVYERYFNSGSTDLLNDTRSAMKSVTALAVGVAIADGAIPSVKAPAFAFLTDLKPFKNDSKDKEDITIEDLLTMSSALDCNDDDDKSPGNEDRMHEQQNWTRWAVDLPTMKDYRRDASGLGPWRYCTTGAFLLGQIVQRAEHMPVDKFIEQRLLLPLGITKWEWPCSPAGETMTGGGLRLRARDIAKLVWMLSDGGRWQGKQIIPASFVESALTTHRDAYKGLTYGYLFWHHDYTTPCGTVSGWYMAGNGGNALLVLKDIDAAAVVARANYNTHGMHDQTTALLETYLLPALKCPAAK